MIEEIWHDKGHYFKMVNGITEEITVDQWLLYFTD